MNRTVYSEILFDLWNNLFPETVNVVLLKFTKQGVSLAMAFLFPNSLSTPVPWRSISNRFHSHLMSQCVTDIIDLIDSSLSLLRRLS